MYLAHLEKLSRTRLADVLVEEAVLEREKVEEAQAEQEASGRHLGEILVENEILSEYDLAKLVTTHWSLPYLDIAGYQVKREVVARLPLDFCEKHGLLPLDEFGSMLTIAVTEMPEQELVQSIIEQTTLTPCLFVALRRGILNALAEEKKRTAGKPPARPATSAGASQAPAKAAATVAPPPAAAPQPSPAAREGKPDLPLPEFDLPTVSMKLVGASAQKVAATSQRISAVREAPAAAKPGAALGWMDSAAKAPAAAQDTAKARISKFGSPAPAPKSEPVPAKTQPIPAPGAKPGGGAWQSIFDVAEESMKKPGTGPAGRKPGSGS